MTDSKVTKITMAYSRGAGKFIRAIEEVPADPPAKRRRASFVMITVEQIHKLEDANATSWRIFLKLLFASYEARGEPFELPTSALAGTKIDGREKNRALTDLEKRGLISVLRQVGKPSLIILAARSNRGVRCPG
jgi:hypothetical protein